MEIEKEVIIPAKTENISEINNQQIVDRQFISKPNDIDFLPTLEDTKRYEDLYLWDKLSANINLEHY